MLDFTRDSWDRKQSFAAICKLELSSYIFSATADFKIICTALLEFIIFNSTDATLQAYRKTSLLPVSSYTLPFSISTIWFLQTMPAWVPSMNGCGKSMKAFFPKKQRLKNEQNYFLSGEGLLTRNGIFLLPFIICRYKTQLSCEYC